jgi:hypothetical protein
VNEKLGAIELAAKLFFMIKKLFLKPPGGIFGATKFSPLSIFSVYQSGLACCILMFLFIQK